MKLGLRRNEVKLSQYSMQWDKEYIKIKQAILHVLPQLRNRVEHIGSTAIKGMTAKPVLDLAVGIDDLTKVDQKFFYALKKLGFFRLRVERPEEIVLAKFTDDTFEEKTHYLHLVEYNKDLWNNFIFFRDYLNSNKTARDMYTNLKTSFIEKYPTAGIDKYTDYKAQFVEDIYKRRKD
ncbi:MULTISPECIES: GrpB family protein [Bacillaceae]|uniref:GrpB family protein n=1 Tax=Bacillaceae TaxID=186817 RepID=UPI001E331979|nr:MULTISPECIES: GrpB family protein [Bacillaceae]MCE4047933.1 GrpB family protein [Bacillus sp. Au-Bac7]MCM3032465.1 GrpB family protein [Niallia sp. MER 6]